MTSRLNPYLNLNGTARQALEFYQGVFGGELNLMTFGDMGAAEGSDAGKIMHGQLESDAGDTLRGYFEQLAAGGVTEMPLQKQVWGDEFGMCVDKFGISWLVNISQPQAEPLRPALLARGGRNPDPPEPPAPGCMMGGCHYSPSKAVSRGSAPGPGSPPPPPWSGTCGSRPKLPSGTAPCCAPTSARSSSGTARTFRTVRCCTAAMTR